MPSFMRAPVLTLALQACWIVAASGKDAGRLVRKTGAESIEADGSVKPFVDRSSDIHSGRVAMSVSPSALVDMSAATDAEAKAQALLAEVEGMVRSGSDPDGSKDSRIRTIKDIVEKELLPDCKAIRDAAQDQVKTNLGEIDKCNAKSTSLQKSIETTEEEEVDGFRKDHESCRSTELTEYTNKTEHCATLDDFLNGVDPKTPCGTFPQPRERAAMVKFTKCMSTYFCPKGPRAEELDKSCKDAEKAHLDKKEECSKLQDLFESGFCQWRQRLIDACKAHSTCYMSAMETYKTHVDDTTLLVKRWKTEFAALKKISCYVDVWLSDDNTNTASDTKLNECDGKEVDTSPMDVDFGKPADQATCDMADIEIFPGEPRFPKKEYSALGRPADDPLSCLEETTPPPKYAEIRTL